MAILFSGDFHANKTRELNSITEKTLLEKHGRELYNSIKYHIILGDAGFMRHDNGEKDMRNYKALARRPFPILCVLGEGEPVYGMKDILEVDIGLGETVYQINAEPFVAYLKRGKVYTIDGIRFLVLGGALSKDKDRRKNENKWWKMEYWTEQEKQDLFKLLETEYFDYVISHTGPHHINKKLFEHENPDSQKLKDEVAFLNDEIHNRIQFCEWLCGHWHRDEYYFDEEAEHGYHYLYRKTKVLVLEEDGGMTIYHENQYEFLKKYFIRKE